MKKLVGPVLRRIRSVYIMQEFRKPEPLFSITGSLSKVYCFLLLDFIKMAMRIGFVNVDARQELG